MELPVPNRQVMISFARAMAKHPSVVEGPDDKTTEIDAAYVLDSWIITEKPLMWLYAYIGWQAATGVYYAALDARTMHNLLVDSYNQLATYANIHLTVH